MPYFTTHQPTTPYFATWKIQNGAPNVDEEFQREYEQFRSSTFNKIPSISKEEQCEICGRPWMHAMLYNQRGYIVKKVHKYCTVHKPKVLPVHLHGFPFTQYINTLLDNGYGNCGYANCAEEKVVKVIKEAMIELKKTGAKKYHGVYMKVQEQWLDANMEKTQETAGAKEKTKKTLQKVTVYGVKEANLMLSTLKGADDSVKDAAKAKLVKAIKDKTLSLVEVIGEAVEFSQFTDDATIAVDVQYPVFQRVKELKVTLGDKFGDEKVTDTEDSKEMYHFVEVQPDGTGNTTGQSPANDSNRSEHATSGSTQNRVEPNNLLTGMAVESKATTKQWIQLKFAEQQGIAMPEMLVYVIGRYQKRIEVPVKGRHCDHLQPFDAMSFLSRPVRYQRCPQCNKRIRREDLVKMEYFQEIFDHLEEFYPRVVQIEIRRNGKVRFARLRALGLSKIRVGDDGQLKQSLWVDSNDQFRRFEGGVIFR